MYENNNVSNANNNNTDVLPRNKTSNSIINYSDNVKDVNYATI